MPKYRRLAQRKHQRNYSIRDQNRKRLQRLFPQQQLTAEKERFLGRFRAYFIQLFQSITEKQTRKTNQYAEERREPYSKTCELSHELSVSTKFGEQNQRFSMTISKHARTFIPDVKDGRRQSYEDKFVPKVETFEDQLETILRGSKQLKHKARHKENRSRPKANG